jgi:tRNA(fMet)-specific endonuclease VapC
VYSLDSDTVNGIIRGQPSIIKRVQAENPEDLWVCTIVLEELVGKQISQINSLRSQRKLFGRESQFLTSLMGILAIFPILSYTDAAEELYLSWSAKQRRIGPNDCRIAASAMSIGLTVMTCNGKDFSVIPGLNWQDWSQP